MDSPFYGVSDDSPLVCVEVISGSGRGLECVECGDLVAGLVLDVIAVDIAPNLFLLCRPFVGGKWRNSLAGDG